ncbi:hypothetical protein HY251_15200 [bacterium]|nr:hypothetical protein [bacterium]
MLAPSAKTATRVALGALVASGALLGTTAYLLLPESESSARRVEDDLWTRAGEINSGLKEPEIPTDRLEHHLERGRELSRVANVKVSVSLPKKLVRGVPISARVLAEGLLADVPAPEWRFQRRRTESRDGRERELYALSQESPANRALPLSMTGQGVTILTRSADPGSEWEKRATYQLGRDKPSGFA